MKMEYVEIAERLGVSYSVLIFVGALFVYVARRLVNPKDGIMTKWEQTDSDMKQRLSRFCDHTESFQDQHVRQAEIAVADIGKLKAAAVPACELFRTIAKAYPDQHDDIVRHADEIERIIHSEAG